MCCGRYCLKQGYLARPYWAIQTTETQRCDAPFLGVSMLIVQLLHFTLHMVLGEKVIGL